MTSTATREHTDAQLRAAWRVYKLPTWPAAFEDVMADPVLSRLVHVHAAHMARAPKAPIARPAPSPGFARPSRTWFDAKRAAAGDRDDD